MCSRCDQVKLLLQQPEQTNEKERREADNGNAIESRHRSDHCLASSSCGNSAVLLLELPADVVQK